MAFRKTISQAELGQNLTAEQRASGPTYSASRGGHYPAEPKPTPGAGNGSNGRLSKGGK
ncbi:hypothetical protein ACFYN3_39550 [Streptomyces lavendulae]|uniref:hypothetical protein n=1 Tax=Streptomyces lavendulae TaxID=1914 RepID=UPI0036CFF458